MNQILRCDCLPKRARWNYLARSGLPALSRKKISPESHIINSLLTKLSLYDQDGLILASFFFGVFIDLHSVSVHKHAKKELGQYPAIWTSHLVNNPYVLHIHSTSVQVTNNFIINRENLYPCQLANQSVCLVSTCTM